MADLENPFYGEDLAWLNAALTTWKAAHQAVATGTQYLIDFAGTRRELRRADLEDIQRTVGFLRAEINRQNQVEALRVTYPDHSRVFVR